MDSSIPLAAEGVIKSYEYLSTFNSGRVKSIITFDEYFNAIAHNITSIFVLELCN